MKVEVLGNMQDGGAPHLGCDCEICESAREDKTRQRYVSSLLLKEDGDEDSVRYLVEATPDLRFQVNGRYLDGVFISQGHQGHIGGLPQLGTEGLNASKLSVYCCPDVCHYIMSNDPLRLLADRNHIETQEFDEEEEIDIQGGSVQPVKIDHRHVNTDTTTFTIKGEEKTLYYVSDTDEWSDKILRKIEEADIAIVDGTFWSSDEIERYDEVSHPTIRESMEKMDGFETEIYFTHLNHTNPVLKEDSEEREELEKKGFEIAEEGMEIKL